MPNQCRYTATQIENLYIDYLDHLKTQGFIKPELIKSGERAGEVINVVIPKPQSVEGFCLFAGMLPQLFFDYIKGDQVSISKEVHEAFIRVNVSIKDHQVTGGLANVLNPMLAARINGIADKTENTIIAEPTTIINIQGVELSTKE